MLNEALRKVVAALDRLGVPHALIGGLAVAARGAIRATRDVDLIVATPIQEALSLERSLRNNGFAAAFHRGASDDPIPGVLRLAIPVSGTEIDAAQLLKLQTPSERIRWKAAAARLRLMAEYNRSLTFLKPSRE